MLISIENRLFVVAAVIEEEEGDVGCLPTGCFLCSVPVQSVVGQAGARTGRSRVGAMTETGRASSR